MPYKTTLPDITDKQTGILELVFKFRFINRHQLQKLLNHKDARRINAWLKDLVDKKYLGRIYSHKLLENTKPAIYYLGNNGISWVKWNKGDSGYDLETKYVKKFYADKHASQIFINHCISLCELYVLIREHEKTILWEYSFTTKTELWIKTQLHKEFDDMKDYLPDVFIDKVPKEYDNDDKFQTFFLELFDAHAPRFYLRYKVNQYIKFHDDENLWGMYENGELKPPIILFILPNQQKLNRLAKYIQEQLDRSYEVEDIEFHLTTYEKAVTEGLDGKIWRIVTEEV